MPIVNLIDTALSCPDTWSPLIVADINSTTVKVARVKDDFVWHQHECEDEAFLVLKGKLTICYRNREDVVLGPGDLHVVPRGVEHCPKAEKECLIVLIEQSTTAHTGRLKSPLTRSVEQQRLAAAEVLGE